MERARADGPAADRLREGALALGLVLGPNQIDVLERYLQLLGDWGKVFNLSAVRDPLSAVSLHLLDSLAVAPAIDRWSHGRPLRLLDVGSGAGLPGLPLAIARPQWSVTTIDAVGKKVAFVRQAAGELGLANVRALQGRVGQTAASGLAPDFDVIVSRAFSDLATFVDGTRALLAPGGVWLAMKGQVPDAEIAALPRNVEVFHVEQLAVLGLDAARCLVWIRPH
jgi:16S rRNA (guanine527-N7)-methyltransferase